MVKELREFWDGLPHKAVFGVLLLAWVVLFHFLGNAVFGYTNTGSLWTWLNVIYENASRAGPEQGNTADDALGRWVPVLVLFFCWLKRRELLDAPKRPWAPALALVVLGLGLHAVGFLVQQTRVSVLGCIVGGYGLVGLVWGPAFLRAVFFPYCLLLFCMPLAAVLPTSQLRTVVASVSTGICDWLLNLKLVRQGTIIYSPSGRFHFDVAPACSGIRSLTVVVLLTTCYAFLNLKAAWRRAILIGAALPVAVIGNILRLTVVIVVGNSYGQNAAMMIETKFGFATFLFALGSVFLLGFVLERLDKLPLAMPRPKADSTPRHGSRPPPNPDPAE